jgi:hypothetical protein
MNTLKTSKNIIYSSPYPEVKKFFQENASTIIHELILYEKKRRIKDPNTFIPSDMSNILNWCIFSTLLQNKNNSSLLNKAKPLLRRAVFHDRFEISTKILSDINQITELATDYISIYPIL